MMSLHEYDCKPHCLEMKRESLRERGKMSAVEAGKQEGRREDLGETGTLVVTNAHWEG